MNPDEMLPDPAQEKRARVLSEELRCLVCQNQSIDDSNATLARDLRLVVRERIKAGDSDAAVLAYLRARYGDFVLLRPPVEPATYALWFGPPVIGVLGLVGIWLYYRRRRGLPEPAAPLSGDEQRRLAALLTDADAPVPVVPTATPGPAPKRKPSQRAAARP